MTVNNTDNSFFDTPDGSTTEFSFPFKLLKPEDLKMFYVGVDGIYTPITTGFTVTLNATTEGGKVTFTIPPVGPGQIYGERQLAETQPTRIPNNEPFNERKYEQMHDRAVMLIQQVSAKIRGAIRIAAGENNNTILPAANVRANKLVGFDVNGDITLSSRTIEQIESGATDAAAYAAQALASANSADASEALALQYSNDASDASDDAEDFRDQAAAYAAQAGAAVNRYFIGTFGGTGNALTATIPGFTLLNGVVVEGIIPAANTTNITLVVNGDAVNSSVRKRGAANLESGDTVGVGYIAKFQWNASLSVWQLLNPGNATLAQGALYNGVRITTTTPYVVVNSDDSIEMDASGGAKTITMPTASAHTGRNIKIQKTDSTLNIVTITGVTTLNTQNETVLLVSNGTSWIVKDRYIPSVWTAYTTTLTHSSGGITNNVNTFKWRRVGDMIEIIGNVVFSNASAAFSGLNFSIPVGLTVDASRLPSGGSIQDEVGNVTYVDAGTAINIGRACFFSTTAIVCYVINVAATYAGQQAIANNTPFTFSTSDGIYASVRLPISGW